MARRHQEADLGVPDRAAHQAHVGVDVDAKRRQHIGRTRLDERFRLPVRDGRPRGHHQRRRGRDVEAPEPRRRCRRIDGAGRRVEVSALARIARAAPVTLDALAATRAPSGSRPSAKVWHPRHHRVEGVGCFLLGEALTCAASAISALKPVVSILMQGCFMPRWVVCCAEFQETREERMTPASEGMPSGPNCTH